MSRILLADDSPHAQRMGERILREEGHQVVTVTDGDTAMLRLKDVDPDVILADVSMPHVSGYEICHYVKNSGNHARARVILTVGAVEPLDESEAKRVQADGVLKKPFEASALVAMLTGLSTGRSTEMIGSAATSDVPRPARSKTPESRGAILVLDHEQVRAAVTIALDASMSSLVEQITEKVVIALSSRSKTHAR